MHARAGVRLAPSILPFTELMAWCRKFNVPTRVLGATERQFCRLSGERYTADNAYHLRV